MINEKFYGCMIWINFCFFFSDLIYRLDSKHMKGYFFKKCVCNVRILKKEKKRRKTQLIFASKMKFSFPFEWNRFLLLNCKKKVSLCHWLDLFYFVEISTKIKIAFLLTICLISLIVEV